MKPRPKKEKPRRDYNTLYYVEIKRYRKPRRGVKYMDCECNQQTIAGSCDKCQYYQNYQKIVNTNNNAAAYWQHLSDVLKERLSDNMKLAIQILCCAGVVLLLFTAPVLEFFSSTFSALAVVCLIILLLAISGVMADLQ